MQEVKVYGVQDRRSTVQAKLPWVVRYTIDGRHRSKSFRTRVEAERYRGLLLQAVQAGGRFDESSGEPESWQTPLRDVRVHNWSRRWLAEQWQEWQPRSAANSSTMRTFMSSCYSMLAEIDSRHTGDDVFRASR